MIQEHILTQNSYLQQQMYSNKQNGGDTLFNKIKKNMKLTNNNEGSTIVTVLVTVLFLLTLGSTLVYMSYTGHSTRITAREGTENFYDATEVMDQIQLGFQDIAGDAVTHAYREALKYYIAKPPTENFTNEFKLGVENWQFTDSAGNTGPAVSSGKYKSELLKSFLVSAGIPASDIGIIGDGNIYELNTEGAVIFLTDSIVFEDVSVTYNNTEDDYTTTVTSDIVLKVPNFPTVPISGGGSASGLSDYALISDATVHLMNDSSIVGGGAYAKNEIIVTTGNVEVGNGSIVSSNLVTKDLNVGAGASLITGEETSLWVTDITLNNNSELTVNGIANVANDLTLAGYKSKFTSTDIYRGFGNSLVSPDSSSAILINGYDASLDLSAAHEVLLAGHSFIQVSTSTLFTGESISVRPNQLAYLVPISVINDAGLTNMSSNPATGTSAFGAIEWAKTVGNSAENMSKVLWTINGVPKTRADYDAKMIAYSTELVPGSGTTVVAVYFDFSGSADPRGSANEYFRDYFSLNSSEILSYLNGYAELSKITNASTSGNYFSNNKTSDGAGGTVNNYSLQSTEDQVHQGIIGTLESTFDTAYQSGNLYDRMIKSDAVDAFPKNKVNEFTLDGDVVALFVNGMDYVVGSSTPSTVKYILCTGDVEVVDDFEGTIIAGGEIIVRPSVTVDISPVEADRALDGTNPDGGYTVNAGTPDERKENTFGDLFIGNGDDSAGGTENTDPSWNLDNMVRYINWKKS